MSRKGAKSENSVSSADTGSWWEDTTSKIILNNTKLSNGEKSIGNERRPCQLLGSQWGYDIILRNDIILNYEY